MNTGISSALIVIGALSFAALLASASAASSAQGTLKTEDARQQVEERVTAYVALRARVTASVPRLQVVPDVAQIQKQVDVLAASIRAARGSARLGDLFTPEVRLVMRADVRNALADAHIAVEELLDQFDYELPPGSEPPAVDVNDSFPWTFGAAMPSLLLDLLPPLPAEVQYRFIGRDLVLVDVDANLVIDVLPNALPQSYRPVACQGDASREVDLPAGFSAPGPKKNSVAENRSLA